MAAATTCHDLVRVRTADHESALPDRENVIILEHYDSST